MVNDPVKTTPPPVEPERFDPTMGWTDLTQGADQILGADLAKDALLDALVGVPFLIHHLNFRRGVVRPHNGEPKQYAYVSCEAVIANVETLKRRRVNTDDLPFQPDGMIVFNDGSTGIYRQIVQYLAMKGYIALPEPVVESGAHGEVTFDLPPSDWQAINTGESWLDAGGDFLEYSTNIRLECPRGLRLSEYTNDYNPNGSKTRYLG